MKPFLHVLILLLTVHAARAQGSLTPPGPPGPTMKTLDQIEPRIDLATIPADASTLFSINQPGCYYLTSNITSTGKNGIGIHVDNVSIDLGGFSIIGDGTAGRSGVFSSVAVKNIRITRGVIRGFNLSGIILNNSRDVRLSDLTISNNGFSGIYIGEESHIRDCITRDNGSYGIRVTTKSVVTNCSASNNGHIGIHAAQSSHIRDCIANDNGNSGIFVVAKCTLIGNSADGNTLDGVGGGDFVICRDGVSSNNGRHGIILDQQTVISGCAATANAQNGIQIADGVVTGCSVQANQQHGIVTNGGVVKDCQATINGQGPTVSNGAGIVGNGWCRIEGNVCTSNDIGISAPGALIIGNLSTNNTGTGTPSANYHTNSFSANLGPVGTASTTTSPTANFTTP